MSRVTLGKLGGIAQSLGQVFIPAGNNLIVDGDIFHHDVVDAMKMPTGTTAQRPGSPTTGVVRFNTDSNLLEVYNGSAWTDVVGPDVASQSTLGTQENPAISGMALKTDGLNLPQAQIVTTCMLIMIVMVVVGCYVFMLEQAPVRNI